MDSKIDRRKNAEPYVKGEKPSARSEYFGKSYAQGQREVKAARSKALEKKRNKYYVGGNGESGKREAFGSKETPTKESHPQYGHVRSGFKTKKQAENEKHYY